MKYDVIVIGSGPGGYVAANRAAQLGLKTACIEKEKSLGGTCLNVGCIPSKALLQSTEHYAWLQKESKNHGIECADVKVDFTKMMQRKSEVVKGLTDGVAGLFKKYSVDRIDGTAKFTSKNSVDVNGQTLEAANFIIATGSEPIALPFLPFDEKTVVSSTGALALPKIPKKMAVIGGGVIGVEIASVYSRLGTEITIIEMLDFICAGMDESLSKSLLQILKKQGLTFHLGTKLAKAEKKNGGFVLTLEGKEPSSLETEVVLVAIGRRPYTKGLGLEEIGLKLNKGFIEVNGNFQSSIPHIYAIGDLIEGPMLAHKASEEGVAAAEIIAGKQGQVNYMAIPNVIYTHPEVASIGLTEKEAKEKNLDIIIGNCAFRANPRARCAGDTDGFVKVIGAGLKKHLVGMHIIGPHASELISEGMMAIEKRANLQEIAQSPNAHPTFSEAIKEACGQALGISVNL